VVIGDAGTGKSFSMKVAREAWQAQGFNVRGAALAGKAADELQAGSGIESRTLASLEFAWKNGKDKLTSRDVLVIDEAGMIGSRQLGRVLKAAEQAGAKVVLLGDDKQLAAIEAGAAFRAVVQHVGAAEITEVRRQKHAWMREPASSLRAVPWPMAWRPTPSAATSKSTAAGRRRATPGGVLCRRPGQGKPDHPCPFQCGRSGAQPGRARCPEGARRAGRFRPFVTERGGREFAAGDRIVFLKTTAI
jgi:hypothetical protein